MRISRKIHIIYIQVRKNNLKKEEGAKQWNKHNKYIDNN